MMLIACSTFKNVYVYHVIIKGRFNMHSKHILINYIGSIPKIQQNNLFFNEQFVDLKFDLLVIECLIGLDFSKTLYTTRDIRNGGGVLSIGVKIGDESRSRSLWSFNKYMYFQNILHYYNLDTALPTNHIIHIY